MEHALRDYPPANNTVVNAHLRDKRRFIFINRNTEAFIFQHSAPQVHVLGKSYTETNQENIFTE